ncbi:hypothetical protein [Rhizobium rhizogenes]|uniref:hypothetical protein n=1 Tax=Rhizobium rhizogenes TaxID=359 RepID=UPI00157421B0|nr:hypothetical protein [Rhizobium rhizogenes]NTI27650.1 hypothetical protein [Rhizobium rhizogenes]
MGVTLGSELWWLPLMLTIIVFVLALANVAAADGALASFRNGALLACASVASGAVWLMWAMVLR